MDQEKYSTSKSILFLCLSILLPAVSLLIISEIVLRFLPVQSATRLLDVNSSQPIAKYQPNNRITYSIGWNFLNVVEHRINNDGFANRKDYNLNLKPTIAVFGDSYVEAFQVPQKLSFHGLLQDEFANKCNVFSFGISGAPLSQYIAWTKYAQKKYSPSVLVFNIVGNDFDESYRDYKDQQGYWHYQGPNKDFEYVLTPRHSSLFKRIIRHSALARYLYANVMVKDRLQNLFANYFRHGRQETFVDNKQADYSENKMIISKKVVDRFFEDIIREAELPAKSIIFTVDGMRQAVYGIIARDEAERSYVGVIRRYFIEKAEAFGFTTIDLYKSFEENYRKNGEKFEFPYDWHWNERGHSIVFNELRQLDWGLCK